MINAPASVLAQMIKGQKKKEKDAADKARKEAVEKANANKISTEYNGNTQDASDYLNGMEGLCWDKMTDEQKNDMELFVIGNPVLNEYYYKELWQPMGDFASDMVYAIYTPID